MRGDDLCASLWAGRCLDQPTRASSVDGDLRLLLTPALWLEFETFSTAEMLVFASLLKSHASSYPV